MSLSLVGRCALRPLKKSCTCVLPFGCKASMRVRPSPKCVGSVPQAAPSMQTTQSSLANRSNVERRIVSSFVLISDCNQFHRPVVKHLWSQAVRCQLGDWRQCARTSLSSSISGQLKACAMDLVFVHLGCGLRSDERIPTMSARLVCWKSWGAR